MEVDYWLRKYAASLAGRIQITQNVLPSIYVVNDNFSQNVILKVVLAVYCLSFYKITFIVQQRMIPIIFG